MMDSATILSTSTDTAPGCKRFILTGSAQLTLSSMGTGSGTFDGHDLNPANPLR